MHGVAQRTLTVPDDLLIGEQVTILPAALREWRKAKGWSQRELARRAECSEGLVSTIESGHRQAALSNALKLAEALGVTIYALGLVHIDITPLKEDPAA